LIDENQLSSIDLAKLIACKEFSIPAGSSAIPDLVFEYLQLEEAPADWEKGRKRRKSGTFNWDDEVWAYCSLLSYGLPTESFICYHCSAR